MSQQRLRASRRRFLTSIGATAAMLPFLRSLPGYAQGAAPTKLVLVFSPNGRIRHLWGGDDSSGSLVFRDNLKALQPIAEHVLVTEGIRNYAAPNTTGTHEGGMASLFTGSATGKQDGTGVGYPSIDTLFMASVTGTARKESLYQQVVGRRDTAENRGPNNRCAFDATGVPRDPYKSCWEVMEQYMAGAVMSMSGPTPNELAEGRAQTAMFAALNQQMGALIPRLCNEDRTQLEKMREALDQAGQTVTQVVCSLPTIPTKPTVDPGAAPIWAPPADASIDLSSSSHWYRDRSRLAIDLLVAALACGVTRSGVLQFEQAASNAQAKGQSLDHHNMSHQVPQLFEFQERLAGMAPDYKQVCVDHEMDPSQTLLDSHAQTWSDLSAWEKFYAEEFTYLVTRLKESGVLDDTLVLWGTEIDNSSAHQHFNMPFLLASGANIPIQRNKAALFPISHDSPDGCVPVTGRSPSHNELLQTVLQAVGLNVDSVGSAMGVDVNANKAAYNINQGIIDGILA